MDKIVGVVGGGSLPGGTYYGDDFSDRLVYNYSSFICIIFAVVVSTSIYVGEPINCWAPAHFSDNWQEYTNAYCWVQNTYYLPFSEYIPHSHEEDKRQMIPYYQWIPFLLLIQALLFFLPAMLWRSISPRSGIDMNTLVTSAHEAEKADSRKKRREIFDQMVGQMDRFLTISENQQRQKSCTLSIKNICSKTLCRACSRSKGNYLSASYILVKLVYIIDVVAQLFALNFFLGQSFSMYGFEFVREVFSNSTSPQYGYAESERFPRVTMCDVVVRRLGNQNRYTVQCVLPVNLFAEKIYLFLWFWMMLVIILLVISLFKWIFRSLFSVDRTRYVRKHLRFMGLLSQKGEPQLEMLPNPYTQHETIEMTTSFSPTSSDEKNKLYPDTEAPVDTPPPSTYHTMEQNNNYPHAEADTQSSSSHHAMEQPNMGLRKQNVKALVTNFAQDYLKTDGLFVLRMLSHNTSPLTATTFVYALFRNYQKHHLPQENVKAPKDSDGEDEDD